MSRTNHWPALGILALGACSTPRPASPSNEVALNIPPLEAGAPMTSAPVASDDAEIVTESRGLPGGEASVGRPAPGITAESVVGDRPLRLRRGRVTVLHFFATWCAPCRQSMPALERLRVAHEGRGLRVMALSVDDGPLDREAVASFAQEAHYEVGWDEGTRVADSYRVETMPSTFVIDRDGIVRFVFGGYHAGEDAAIERAATSLL